MAPLVKTLLRSPVAVTTNKLPHNKKQQAKKFPAKTQQGPIPISHVTAVAPAYTEFRNNTGLGSNGSNKEVIIDTFDFGDVTGVDWTALGYQLATMPGYFVGSAIRLLSIMLDVLPPAMTANTATNNVLVLAGVRMQNEGGVLNSPSLCAGRQTLIPPSNKPDWINVMHANMDRLTKSGFQASSNAAGITEVARVSLLNPDTGAFSTATTLQTRIRMRYAVSLPLRTTVTVATSTVANSDTIPPFATPVAGAIVYPKVISMQNAL